MALVITSPADVVNLALERIGYKLRVANLYDGSEAASVALDLYGQTRDRLLRDGEWEFASTTIAATLLKQAPTPPNYFDTPWDPVQHPPMPWRFEYEYPTDCLKVRIMKVPVGYLFEPSPLPTLMAIANDKTYTPAKEVVLCNVPSALMVYTRQVTDPTTWPVDFTEAFAAELGAKMKARLVDQPATQMDVAMAAAATATAAAEKG